MRGKKLQKSILRISSLLLAAENLIRLILQQVLKLGIMNRKRRKFYFSNKRKREVRGGVYEIS